MNKKTKNVKVIASQLDQLRIAKDRVNGIKAEATPKKEREVLKLSKAKLRKLGIVEQEQKPYAEQLFIDWRNSHKAKLTPPQANLRNERLLFDLANSCGIKEAQKVAREVLSHCDDSNIFLCRRHYKLLNLMSGWNR